MIFEVGTGVCVEAQRLVHDGQTSVQAVEVGSRPFCWLSITCDVVDLLGDPVLNGGICGQEVEGEGECMSCGIVTGEVEGEHWNFPSQHREASQGWGRGGAGFQTSGIGYVGTK